MKFFAAALIFLGAAACFAQAPEVPHKMQFAGMTLTIRDDARREIQKDVDALTQHGRYYSIKAERAKTYFPIIEKIFEEEHLPDDFKYLALQESALVPDAVSVSNAVGFWQFKDYTAMSMGMRVDRQVDERMNLISATRGAARYLKQNNYIFNNWVYALQSYQMGAGGVQRAVPDLQSGTKNMEITSDTYWYVKKFLAHKVAFEKLTPGDALIRVMPYQTSTSKSLKEVAAEVSSNEEVLKDYNKWLKVDQIPIDKQYVLLVPAGKLDGDFNKLVLTSSKASKAGPLANAGSVTPAAMKINGISAIRANSGETVTALAAQAQISLTSFLKYNDIAIDHIVEPGTLYLLGKKKSKGNEAFYKVRAGEDLWSVSQRTGVRISKLKKFNRLEDNNRLLAGTTLWLMTTKPKSDVVELDDTEVAKLNENETFDWYLKMPKADEAVPVIRTAIEPPAQVPVTAIETPAQEPIKGVQTHTVKKGETLTSIAKDYSVTISDLISWNDESVHQGLKPGQILKINSLKTAAPEQKEAVIQGENQGIVHIVKASDTLYGIAREFNVTIRELMEWNDKKDFTLTVGEKLRIPKK